MAALHLSHLRPADWLAFAAAIGVWSVCLVLHLSALATDGIGWLPVQVEAAAGQNEHPSVRWLWPGETTELQVGDTLIRVGETDLQGATRLDFVTAAYRTASTDTPGAVEFLRGGTRGEAELRLLPIPLAWRTALLSAAFVLVGALTFWTARGLPPTRTFFLAAVAYAIHWTYFWGGPPERVGAGILAFALGIGLAFPLTIRTIQSFPPEVAARSTWSRVWPWLLSVEGIGVASWGFGLPLSGDVGLGITVAASVALIAASLTLLTRNYRHANRQGRRAIKWVAFGFYVGLVPPLLAGLATLANPQFWWLYEVSLLAVLAIPPCLFLALTRDHLFDIDRLISAAATYTALSLLVLSSVLVAIPVTARAASEWVAPEVSQSVLSLLTAVGVLMLRARLAPWIEARMFPERQLLVSRAQEVRDALGRCEKPSTLLTTLGERLDDLLHLESIVIYGATGNAYAPVFARGPAVCPAFDADGLVVQSLVVEQRPIYRRGLGRAIDAATNAELAAVDSMGVEVLMPMRLDGGVPAFLCLGAKRSGDAYSSADLSILLGLADKASDRLADFQREEVYRQERAMHEELRKFVPATIADEVQRGGSLEPRETEVTVLFVDIRGYSSFAEPRSAGTIFSAVNAYTNTVSQVVTQHGGAVVEFNGDGMMAVFGAPKPLAEKERAAVEAGREICRAIPHLHVDGDAQLEVGVGIATGEAFVGSIEAVDRKIWSALGNTTNLAARLQSFTRDIDAAIVIDAPTWLGSDEPDDFDALGPIPIRGRRFPIDAFALRFQPTTTPQSADAPIQEEQP